MLSFLPPSIREIPLVTPAKLPSSSLSLLLVGNNLLNIDSGLHRDHDGVFSSIPGVADFVIQTFGEGGQVEVRLLVATFVHQGQVTLFTNVDDFPFGLVDNGHGGSVCGRNHIFQFLARENVHGREVTLGVTVLSGFGNGNVQHLAGLSLDHHVSTDQRVETMG